MQEIWFFSMSCLDARSSWQCRRPGGQGRNPGRMVAELERLLENTDWLTAPGGEGPAMHTDAGEITITVERKGESRTITCHGRREEPYRSLMWFFEGLAYQENLLYKLGWLPVRERRDACREIRSWVEALAGQSGTMHPRFDLDSSTSRDDGTGIVDETSVMGRPFDIWIIGCLPDYRKGLSNIRTYSLLDSVDKQRWHLGTMALVPKIISHRYHP